MSTTTKPEEPLFPMRILHIASGMPEFDRAVRSLGHQSMRIELRDVNNSLSYQKVQESVDWRPHLVFVQAQQLINGLEDLLDKYRKDGSVVVSWTGDVREIIPSYHFHRAPHVDMTMFPSMVDVAVFREHGFRAEHLLPGYDPDIYHNNEDNVRSGIVFIGNDYGLRFPLSLQRRRVVQKLRDEFGPYFVAYGRRFGQRLTDGADAAVYRRAALAVNIEHFNHEGYHSDRWLRIMACGVPMLDATNMYPDEAAINAKAMLEVADCMVQASTLAQRTREEHTWESRIDQVIERFMIS